MLFKSEIISKTWDTWMYHHEGIYYLYYLTCAESGSGDGFGVATSEDGIKWHDYGRVLGPSEKMSGYLGTGSVWKDADFSATRRFLCNYSEWRMDGDRLVQNILFAWSDDLIHWHKFGDEYMFSIDEQFYQKIKEDAQGPWEWPRWDAICVIPRLEGGYYGYWTATPKDTLGFGFGESKDGLLWRSLEPPWIEWGDPPEMCFVEVGGVHEFEHKYYCMLGDYASTHCGMFTVVSESPFGPFRPVAKNFGLLCNQSKMHVYFSRFLDTPEEVLVNHHALAEGQFSDEHFETYFAPLKTAMVIDGGLYLAWWKGNDGLKNREVKPSGLDGEPLRFKPNTGIVLEGTMDLPGSLFIGNRDGVGTGILVSKDGVTEIGSGRQNKATFKCEERVDREVSFGASPRFRLLLNHTMLEFYLDDLLIQCYTMERTADGTISYQSARNLKLWQWE